MVAYPIHTETNIGEEEIAECNGLILKRRQRIMVPIFAAVTAIFTALVIWLQTRGLAQPRNWVYVGLLVLILLYYAFGLKMIVRRSAKKAAAQVGERKLICDFYEDRIETSVGGEKVSANETYDITLLTNVYETEGFFFPALGRSYIPIGKAGMTPEEQEALRELFKAHVPEKKYKVV